jgi:mono/diheme cytochrome c family protein
MRNVAWVQWAMLVLFGCSTAQPTIREEEPAPAEDSPRPGTQKSDDGKFDSTPAPDAGLGVMSFSPDSVHSGFDGEHAFKVPIAVYDANDELVVSAKDPSAATIVAVKLENPVVDGVLDNGKYFMVTPKKAGDIVLVAKSSGRSIEAKLSVTAYTTAQWAAGKQRYENAGTSGEPACTQCHAGSAGIDHSPAALASVDDQKVGTVITSGISTSGFPIKESTGKGHRWEVTEDERAALVTYLRGLEPRGFE